MKLSKKLKKQNQIQVLYLVNLKDLEKKPEALNLINIYSEISKDSIDKVLSEMSGKEYSYLKKNWQKFW